MKVFRCAVMALAVALASPLALAQGKGAEKKAVAMEAKAKGQAKADEMKAKAKGQAKAEAKKAAGQAEAAEAVVELDEAVAAQGEEAVAAQGAVEVAEVEGKRDARTQELEKHARRLARIARIEALAEETTNEKLAEQATKLRGLEDERHTKALARVDAKAGKPEKAAKAANENKGKGQQKAHAGKGTP